MIEKIRISQMLGTYGTLDMGKKINEIIEHLNGEKPRVLVCPHCGSEEWESHSSSTLMGGPMNYHRYMCKKCGELTRVKRIRRTDPHIYLGPEDEIVS